MIVGLLICTIGLLPVVLALSMKNLYKESYLTVVLTIYMILIAIWQFDVGILHLQNILSEKTILILFKLLRAGPTFSIPVVYYIAYRIIRDQPDMIEGKRGLCKFLNLLFNKIVLWFLIIWSSVLYIIEQTPLTIKRLELIQVSSSLSDYFPVYGPLEWLYLIHVGSFVLFLILVFVISGRILNSNIRHFLRAFAFYSLFLYVSGFLNFSPQVGTIPSSIGVIIFTTMIIREFLNMMSADLKASYYEVRVRQKKLDYTGNLVGSLIHEAKNTNQITKGFSNMLMKSYTMSDKDKSFLEMIHKASVYFEDLANNYQEYMSSSKMKLTKQGIKPIIQNSIELSKGIIGEHQVEIEFVNNDNKPLNACVNKTNLEQVFINLIKNSVESIPDNRKIKKITITTDLDAEMIIINLFDTGKGVAPDRWESVFDPFVSFNGGGMGLGLPFVKKIIIEHLGNIDIIASSPEGTHLRIELPHHVD